MAKKGRQKFFYAASNTASGFKAYYNSILADMEKIYILKGAPGIGKSTIINNIGKKFLEEGYDVEFIVCASNGDFDGFIVPFLKIAVIDGSYPHSFEPQYPGVVEEIINLDSCWDNSFLEKEKESIVKLTNESKKAYAKAYRFLETAKEIHDQWERYFVEGLDTDLADKKAEQLISEIFSPQRPLVKHFFASAITPEGTINYIDNITASLKRRYILKGQPGTGKSTLIKKISKKALEKGFFVDMYHCSLDPENIDMIVIEQLSTAVIHGTEPHLFEPSRPGDIVVDMLECVAEDVIDKYKKDILIAEEEFDLTLKQTVKSLKEAYKTYKDLSEMYKKATDFKKVEKIEKDLEAKINSFVNRKKNI